MVPALPLVIGSSAWNVCDENSVVALCVGALKAVHSQQGGVSVLFVLWQDFRDAVAHASRQLGKPVIEDRILNQILYYLPQLYELNRDLLRELEERLSHWWLSINGFHSFDVEIYLVGFCDFVWSWFDSCLFFKHLPKHQNLLWKYRRLFFHLDVLLCHLDASQKVQKACKYGFVAITVFIWNFIFNWNSGLCRSISALSSLGKKTAVLKTALHFRGSLDLLIRHSADWQLQSPWTPFSVTTGGWSYTKPTDKVTAMDRDFSHLELKRSNSSKPF